ncbi:MAG: radical SAM family heme chaperone HemW [Clostridia bacterium]
MILQLYLHFPFCKCKCLYCDFQSAAMPKEQVSAYCEALEKEVRLMGKRYAGAQISTVFLGGGTPSIVPPQEMRRVLKALHEAFEWLPFAEFTSEANPGTLSEEWLNVLSEQGLNRLSLGVQATQNHLLKAIGRIHTFEQAEQAVALARHCGIHNLNTDLMFGLPGQSLADYLESIETVSALQPEHISAYSLILEEKTPLFDMVERGTVTMPEDDLAGEMFARGIEGLNARGYQQYEVSNFAKQGYACKHNMGYWQGAWYLGLGLAAHSMLPPENAEAAEPALRLRRANTCDMHTYLTALHEDKLPIAQEEHIGAQEAMFETMMLGLRMTAGVSEADFLHTFGKTLQSAYGGVLEGLVADGLALWRGDGRFTLTARGLEMQNDVLLRLMK